MCDYLSMLGLKFIHASKRGPRYVFPFTRCRHLIGYSQWLKLQIILVCPVINLRLFAFHNYCNWSEIYLLSIVPHSNNFIAPVCHVLLTKYRNENGNLIFNTTSKIQMIDFVMALVILAHHLIAVKQSVHLSICVCITWALTEPMLLVINSDLRNKLRTFSNKIPQFLPSIVLVGVGYKRAIWYKFRCINSILNDWHTFSKLLIWLKHRHHLL